MGTGNYRDTSNNTKLVHWPLMGGLLHLVERGGDRSPPRPILAVGADVCPIFLTPPTTEVTQPDLILI